jgi:general secretion pathway protein M
MKLNALVTRYESLAVRDQRILRIGAVAMLLIALVWIFLPLHRNLGAARERLVTAQADLEWMRSVAPTLAAAGPGPVAQSGGESLVVLIDTSARESGLAQALTGSEPVPGGAMRVRLEAADFNLFTAWLARLGSQHGVRVESSSVTAQAGKPGVVNASVQLRAAQ